MNIFEIVYTYIMESFDNFDKYVLIGIGEFSHGIQESWKFRYKLLKHYIRTTNKKIFIFNEMSIWQSENIMNHTEVIPNTEKFVRNEHIKIEKPIDNGKSSPAWGKLWQYVVHSSESKIFYKILKYIRRNINRITLVGIDNDTLAREYDMYNNILAKLDIENKNRSNINFLWAHNYHVDSRLMSPDNYEYTKAEFPDIKHTCGYYLKEKLKDMYCIILSQAYKGINRFNSYCDGYACEVRVWQIKYFYKSFKYEPNKKYVDKKKKYQLLDKFDNKLIEFSNSFYLRNKDGHSDYVDSKTWDYILFWNKVLYLKPFCEYK